MNRSFVSLHTSIPSRHATWLVYAGCIVIPFAVALAAYALRAVLSGPTASAPSASISPQGLNQQATAAPSESVVQAPNTPTSSATSQSK